MRTNVGAESKTTEMTQKENSIFEKGNLSEGLTLSSILSEQVYHELADMPVTRQDPWQQLQDNIDTLQDLQSRYSFVLREVRYLLKA